MKKYFTILIVSAGFLFLGLIANAQMMPGGGMMGSGAGASKDADDHTAREEAEGKAAWEKFQKKEITCEKLSEEDFGALGEYFMGLMLAPNRSGASGSGMGNNHAAMNQMMTNMMGEEGEEAMHVVMGKRLSGCDTSAAFPAGGYGFMPMMQMLAPYGTEGSRSGWGGPWSGLGPPMGTNWDMFDAAPSGRPASLFLLGWLINILWWFLIIAGIVAVIRWLMRRGRSGSALDLLKERYAKGEITKQQFEEMKKDLS